MVQISNKPNISGIKDVSEDAEYSSKLLAREGKLFAGLITTRFKGFAIWTMYAVPFRGKNILRIYYSAFFNNNNNN